jgi:hypothetical protein
MKGLMMTTQTNLLEFSSDDIQDLDVELKIGILGTVNNEGLPHLTMISSLRPYAPRNLVWGQFTEGLSKQYIQENSKTGFLIMSLDKHLWRGKADFTHSSKSGPEFDNYNNLPMFRYNAYFGVHTVYYMDLVSNSGRAPLPMGQVVLAAIQTILARSMGRKKKQEEIINRWTRSLLNKLDNLKFLGYIGEDGYPVVLPIIQTQAWDSQRIIFSLGAYGEELKDIPAGVSMAVFGMSFDMEDVLLRGTFSGFKHIAGVRCGVVEIDWVYNAMPPKPQQIYPPLKIEPIREF